MPYLVIQNKHHASSSLRFYQKWLLYEATYLNIRKNIFAYLFSIHNTISLSRESFLDTSILITASLGTFIAPHVWEIVGRKNLTIFKGCHYSRFHIMIPLSFWKIETKNLNSDPHNFNFPRTGWELHHQLHIRYLNISSDHGIEAATRGL